MDEESLKTTCNKEKGKRGGTHQPFYATWAANFMLSWDAGRFMLGKYLSGKKEPARSWKKLCSIMASMEAKETIGHECGRNYTNGQFFNQNRQDAISRVSAVQDSARGPR